MQFVLLNYKTNSLKDAEWGGNITSNSFIIRSNNPITLLAKFNDIIQTTILRNPVDLISSSITKAMGGIGNNIVAGISMPHEYNYLSIDRLVPESFNVYKNYSYGIEKNIKNLKAFTFEQVTEDIAYVVKNLINEYANNDEIDKLKIMASSLIQQHNKGDIGYNNALPIPKKPEIYYKAKEIILNHKDIDKINSIYKSCKDIIVEEQKTWSTL